MSLHEKTRKCPICGRPYVVYAYYADDQSACPKCRAEARRNPGKYAPPSAQQDDGQRPDR